jgi:hydrogenase expression/formation protein HypE
VFLAELKDPLLQQQGDAALVEVGGAPLAFTTDAFVVRPLFFPGGDIGSLSVYGTVNDLAMQGAQPLYLSAAFILEEGFPVALLRKVAASMQAAARRAGVHVVCGDTKVIERKQGDELVIATAGIGACRVPYALGGAAIRPGDAIVLNGDLGRHGIAIMAVREGLEFSTTIESDLMPLAQPVQALLEAGVEVHAMRDLTRGGLASALNELAAQAQRAFHLQETAIPVSAEVEAACELLGLDPLYVANEGRFVAFVAEQDAPCALKVLAAAAPGLAPALIGRVGEETVPWVRVQSPLGAERILDMLSGEQLPRIC